jgi:hypothetical protein
MVVSSHLNMGFPMQRYNECLAKVAPGVHI